jgi:ribosomal protein S18 acetylase RimI-like enzyme
MSLTILPFDDQHAQVFDRLNRAWIEQYFTIEPIDELVLTQPEKMIITPGGEIWFAALNGDVIGACAILNFAPGIFEFTKLGVDEKARGKGVARALLRHCTARARARGAHTLKIFTNTRLAPACTLYRSENFTEIPMNAEERARYVRGDVMFELALTHAA